MAKTTIVQYKNCLFFSGKINPQLSAYSFWMGAFLYRKTHRFLGGHKALCMVLWCCKDLESSQQDFSVPYFWCKPCRIPPMQPFILLLIGESHLIQRFHRRWNHILSAQLHWTVDIKTSKIRKINLCPQSYILRNNAMQITVTVIRLCDIFFFTKHCLLTYNIK